MVEEVSCSYHFASGLREQEKRVTFDKYIDLAEKGFVKSGEMYAEPQQCF